MRFLLALTAVAGCATTDAAPPAGRTFSDEAYAQHIKDLRARLTKLGLGNLEIRIEDPFVVVGEGTAKQLERSAGTVRWAADINYRLVVIPDA